MMEKVKNFFAGLASLTAFLYAAGYIAEYAHARMLGIPMAQPLNEYYLISGGTFVVSTLIALYTTIFKHFYFFIVVFIIAGAFLHYEANTPKKQVKKISKTYIIILFISVLAFLFAAVPIFTSPFGFSGFLFSHPETGNSYNHFSYITSELKTWLLNGGAVNKQKLVTFYVLLILSTIISAVMLYTMIKQWKKRKIRRNYRTRIVNSSGWQKLYLRFLKYLDALPGYGFVILIILMIFIVVIHAVSIPINYGIILKSNDYPTVELVLGRQAQLSKLELLENQDPQKEHKLWLLREGRDELLVYAVFFEKGKDDWVRKIISIKKDLVKKMEVQANCFIFKIK